MIGRLRLERILAQFATIAERRDCTERWFHWYTGDPAGMADLVSADELIASGGRRRR